MSDRPRRFSGFASARGGNFVIQFALSTTIIFGAVALAVDYALSLNDKIRISNALDAATLATARAIGTGEVEAKKQKAEDYFNQIFAANMGDDSFDSDKYTLDGFTLDGDSVAADVSANRKSVFSRVAFGNDDLSVASSSQVNYALSKSEVAMVLDVTHSMGTGPGSKLDDLKQAAKLAISILLRANSATDVRSRISLVPYDFGVNAGPLAGYVFPDNNAATSDAPVFDPAYVGNYDVKTYLESHGASCTEVASGSAGKIEFECTKLPWWYKGQPNGVSNDTCATDRKAPNTAGPSYQLTDANPSVGMISRDARIVDCPSSEVVLLTHNEDALLEAVDNLSGGGWTAGQVGLQWAWYTISHNWADYIAGSESDPGDLSKDADLVKYIIFMTDGIFTTSYADNGGYTNKSLPAEAVARKTCTAIKAQGIKIFVVGYQVPGYYEYTLSNCASPDEGEHTYLYTAQTAKELSDVFRTIAYRIQSLRLTQ